jgi:ABC-type methionine transport system ATPase subunit
MNNLKKSQKITPVYTRIRVPHHYYRQPVISRLISRYGLTVNIKAASLIADDNNCGWFDLQLLGTPEQVVNSLSYLQGLGVDLMQVAMAGSIQLTEDLPTFAFSNQHSIPTERIPSTSLWEAQIYSQISNYQINKVRLQLFISKNYYHEPVISQLVSGYGVTVNIAGALLKPHVQDDGWFDLELWGNSKQLFDSCNYLQNFFKF